MKIRSSAFNTQIHTRLRLFLFLVFATFIMLQSRLYAQGLVWSRLYRGAEEDQRNSIIQTEDRGYIAVGYMGSFGLGLKDVYLVKVDSLSYTLWTKTFGGQGDDIGYCVQQTSDSGYIIAGQTNTFGHFNDLYITKTDASGNVSWTKIYGRASDDCAYSVCQTTHEGYIVGGYSNATSPSGHGGKDVYKAKFRNQTVGTEEEKSDWECFDAWQSGSNPFREQVVINDAFPRASTVTISMYNHLGQCGH